jgi:excisionase family DNA binding protein
VRTVPERLLSVREVARILALSAATVYRLAREGALPHLRVGNAIRVHPDDVRRLTTAGRA